MKRFKDPNKKEIRKRLKKVADYVTMCAIIGVNPLELAYATVAALVQNPTETNDAKRNTED